MDGFWSYIILFGRNGWRIIERKKLYRSDFKTYNGNDRPRIGDNSPVSTEWTWEYISKKQEKSGLKKGDFINSNHFDKQGKLVKEKAQIVKVYKNGRDSMLEWTNKDGYMYAKAKSRFYDFNTKKSIEEKYV